ncbi:MAG: DUF5522 domain-containing protein [Pyrinomonadaceae bacterium]
MEIKPKDSKAEKLVEGVDYYFENGLMVLTAHFLEKRGYCCKNNCRHCPYREKQKDDL